VKNLRTVLFSNRSELHSSLRMLGQDLHQHKTTANYCSQLYNLSVKFI